MPPGMKKKRIEEYNSCLSNKFFLNQVLDFTKESMSNQPRDSLDQEQIDFIDSVINTIQEMQSCSTGTVVSICYKTIFEGEILWNVCQYLTTHIDINNGNVQNSIPKPSIDNVHLWFFYLKVFHDNCCMKGSYCKNDLEELIEIAKYSKVTILDQDLPEVCYHPVIDVIVSLLGDNIALPNFYIDDDVLNRILDVVEKYNKRDYLRTIDSAIFHARYSFLDQHTYKHPIYKLVSSILTNLSPLPSFLNDLSATSNISEWPPIELIVNGYGSRTVHINLSINDLVKFQTHLTGFNHLRLVINIPQLTSAENVKFNSCLNRHLSNINENGKGLNLLGSGGSLRLPILFEYMPHNAVKIPNKLIEYLTEFTKKYCDENHKVKVIDTEILGSTLSEYFQKFSCQYRAMSYGVDGRTGLALFNSIKLLKLLYQTLSCQPVDKNLPPELIPCLLQKQIDYILNVLGYTLKVAMRVQNISTQNDFESVLWDISTLILKRILDGNSIILQLGVPKISSIAYSFGHTFYVVFKSSNSKVKIIVVDGGEKDKLDPQYDVIDKGMGARILCRETRDFSLFEPQNEVFLTNYIFKALKLKYEYCSDKKTAEKLLDNIKLKNKDFIGKGVTLTNIPSIESDENSHSLASQNFEDCTMYNLREAFRVLYHWNSAKMAHFMTDSICRFNFLLKQNDQYINQITKQSMEILKDEAKEI